MTTTTTYTPGPTSKSQMASSTSPSITSTTVFNSTLHAMTTAVDPAAAGILFRIRERQEQIAALESLNKQDKLALEDLFTIGDITDKLSSNGVSATRTIRTTWTYSPAIKQLQELEQLEGIATQKQSVSWTVRESKA